MLHPSQRTTTGGERLAVLLLVMISVLAIQEIEVSVLLLNSDSTSATSTLPTRLVFILTILEFTAFSTIFYRLLPPERFATWRPGVAFPAASVPNRFGT